MDTDKANEKGNKAKSADSGCAPTGHGTFEMMRKCCAGQGGSPDCSTMMKGMMEAMKNHSCGSPETGETGDSGTGTGCGATATCAPREPAAV